MSTIRTTVGVLRHLYQRVMSEAYRSALNLPHGTVVFSRDDPETGEEQEVSVEYSVSGLHILATRVDPEEFPDVELGDAMLLDGTPVILTAAETVQALNLANDSAGDLMRDADDEPDHDNDDLKARRRDLRLGSFGFR